MRLFRRSLQGRMLAVSAAAIALALLLAGWTVAGVLGRFVIQGLDQRLDAELALLASAIDRDGRVDDDRLAQVAPALEDGPGWRWKIIAPGRVVGDAPLPAVAPPPPPPDAPVPPARPSHRPIELAGGDGPQLHARTLTVLSARGSVELIAAAPRAVLRQPIAAALAPLLTVLALVAALLVGAAVAQLRLGLRPLRRLAAEVEAIRSGRAERVDEDQPAELRPLAVELNALAAHNAAALAGARLTAANLAHALKTPVATLALELRDDPARAAQVARIEATIRHHLARARLETGQRRAATALAPAAAAVAEAVRRIAGEQAPKIALAVPDDLSVAVEAQDLDELLGNLLDNAARHARTRVTLAAERTDDARRVVVRIADDGPGIPAEARAAATQPGIRLDERAPGHGFGLAIVRELVTLYGGDFSLEDAEGGGLLVVVRLPSAIR